MKKENILEYIKSLISDFNTIILLMLITISLSYFSSFIFTLLFLISLSILALKTIQLYSLFNNLEELLEEDIEIENKESTLNDLSNNAMPNNELVDVDDIKKYIRRLPAGQKASEKAKQLALSYGYELQEGETFVLHKNRG